MTTATLSAGLSPAVLLTALVAVACLALGAVSEMNHAMVIGGSGLVALLAGRVIQSDGDDGAWSTTTAALLWAYPALAAFQLVLAAVTGDHSAPLIRQIEGALLLGAYALFFTAALRITERPDWRRTLVAGLVAIGLVEATYAVLNLLAGNDYLLFYRRKAYFDSATGTLVNRNNFACLLELTIPFAFLRAVHRSPAGGNGKQAEREDGAKGVLFGIGVAVMLLALMLSRSRMGLGSFVVATALVLALDRSLRPAAAAAAVRSSWTTRFVVGATVFLLLGVGLDIAFERFSTSAGDLEAGRLPIWRDTWRMIVAQPLLGSGFGTYESVNSAWRLAPDGFANNHAHSEYLEVLAETGIVGLAVVVAWLVAFARRLVFTLRQTLDPARRDHVLAAAIGIVSITLHSTVDFGLRVPAVALTMLLVVALFLRASVRPGPRGDGPTH